MDRINIKNLFQLPDVFRLPELMASFVTMMLFRCMPIDKETVPGLIVLTLAEALVDGADAGASTSTPEFSIFVFYGFFFICVVQIVATLFGEKSPMSNLVIALCGFIFYLSIGSRIIHLGVVVSGNIFSENIEGPMKALGSLSVLTSFIYCADAGFRVYKFIKLNEYNLLR